MKERINVAEILKHCPKGMELDCTMYESVVLDKIKEGVPFPVYIKSTQDIKTTCLNQYGCFTNDKSAKCVIFPKGKTTWEGFVPPRVFNDGDVVFTTIGNFAIISNKVCEGIYSAHCITFDWGGFTTDKMSVHPERLATKKEKERLFKIIKDNGLKWNDETKTLEKLVESKEDTDGMLNELAKEVLAINEANGWGDKPHEVGTNLMLIVSELAEAMEAAERADIVIYPKTKSGLYLTHALFIVVIFTSRKHLRRI